jgi:hypothetical protein
MSEFAIARYGPDDWRLVKWNGSEETEIGNGWGERPILEQCIEALLDHHGAGNQPFSSREGTIDANILSNDWPLATRDMTVDGETLPWNDAQ